MNEQIQPSRETHHGTGGGLGSIFDDEEPDASQSVATVTCGPHNERLPVANKAVGEIRRRLQARFDIDPRSGAVVNGQNVSDSTVLRAGQVLMFMHRSGEKGAPSPSV